MKHLVHQHFHRFVLNIPKNCLIRNFRCSSCLSGFNNLENLRIHKCTSHKNQVIEFQSKPWNECVCIDIEDRDKCIYSLLSSE